MTLADSCCGVDLRDADLMTEFLARESLLSRAVATPLKSPLFGVFGLGGIGFSHHAIRLFHIDFRRVMYILRFLSSFCMRCASVGRNLAHLS